MAHRYAEMLRWLAEGKTVLASQHGGAEAEFPKLFGPRPIEAALLGEPGWEFRLKPRTVMIGSREVEAPVLEPVEWQELWYRDSSDDSIVPWKYNPANVAGAKSLARGEWFASKDACIAAHDAISALMRGES